MNIASYILLVGVTILIDWGITLTEKLVHKAFDGIDAASAAIRRTAKRVTRSVSSYGTLDSSSKSVHSVGSHGASDSA